MLFFTFSNVDIQFIEKKLIWKSYITAKALPTTKRVGFINKKKFITTVLNENSETFMLYIAVLKVSLEITKMMIHSFQLTQILLETIQLAALQQNKARTKIHTEQVDYVDVFSPDLAIELLKNMSINEYAIKLIDKKQLPYRPIYTLSLVELETLKTYIKTHPNTRFIRLSKFSADTPILFDKKSDNSFHLYVDYRDLNKLTIKNQYFFPLIGKSLDWLGWTKHFTQLDLTRTYYRMRIRESNKWKTAFRTQYGHYEYQVISFRLSNAPASF